MYLIPLLYIKDNTFFLQDYATAYNRLLTPKLFSLLNHATIPNKSLVLIQIYLLLYLFPYKEDFPFQL